MSNATAQVSETLPEERLDRVGWAYRVAKEAERARERFDAWAQDYDRDVTDLLGWRGPDATLDYVLKYVDRDDLILDAGSGTGLMGELLRKEGYDNLVGTDISEKMLEVARQKSIYSRDFQADLTKPLPELENAFDCVVSVGVSGYMKAETIEEFARVTRQGGLIIYTISDQHFENHGFREVVDTLIEKGVLTVEIKGEEFAAIPKSQPDHMARVHVYRVVGKFS